MYTLATLIGLMRLVVRSYNQGGRYTEEYKTLWDAFSKTLNGIVPDPNPPKVDIRTEIKTVYLPAPNQGGDHFDLCGTEVSVGIREGKLSAVKLYKERTGRPLMDC